jgi:DinB family protein
MTDASDSPRAVGATEASEPSSSDSEALVARMQAAVARLAAHASAERPGLTRADEATGERWEAGQVFAHLAEFPAFWVGQVRTLIAARAAGEPEPIPFGRSKADPGRLAAIETRRREEPLALLRDTDAGLAAAAALCRTLTADDWQTCGLHPALGAMSVAEIVDRFLVSHLEEHAAQLDELAATSAAT